MNAGSPAREHHVDFDLHGVVGIRLVDASPTELAVVRRQLGLQEGPLTRAPDVVVRFVDALPTPALRLVEYGRTGFTDDGFFVLQSRKRPAAVRIAFDGIGDCCEIVCQRGLRSVPLLMAIVTLSALKRDCVPLHASAFVHEGRGVLVTGWAKGGKTEALLAFAAHGAQYLGDEWILLTRDGRRMYGIPEFIRLQDWHLRQLPAVRRRVAASRRLFFAAVRGLDRAHGALARGALARLGPVKMLADAMPALRRQLNVQLDPLEVFAAGPRALAATPQTVFLMMSHAGRDIRVDPTDPGEIARRMVASNQYEQQPLLTTYLAYQFAFPGRRNAFIERAPALQAELLASALAGKDAFMVRHPYPCDLGALFDAMAPACAAARAPAAGAALTTAALPMPRAETSVGGAA
jgi:hypothetical protein